MLRCLVTATALLVAHAGWSQLTFTGGNGGGSSWIGTTTVVSHLVVEGGAGDGFASDAVSTLSNSKNVFAGGISDGYAQSSVTNAQSSLAFGGGIGDGYQWTLHAHQPETCLGDLNYDGVINTQDLLILVGEFACEMACMADLNDTPGVDTTDLLVLLGVFGTSCEVL